MGFSSRKGRNRNNSVIFEGNDLSCIFLNKNNTLKVSNGYVDSLEKENFCKYLLSTFKNVVLEKYIEKKEKKTVKSF